MQQNQQQAPQQAQQEAKVTEDFNKNIKDLGLVILIVSIAGWALFKYDSTGNNLNNKPTETIMPKIITAETAYTITDPALQIKPPTQEEVAKYNVEAETKIVVIDTSKGKIKVKLLPKDAPYTVASYMKLIDKGLYNGLIFHRVIKDFMIQGGDPSGNGTGGPGYKFIDELNKDTQSYKDGYKKGVLAMANSGPDTNGSQFFIMLADNTSMGKDYTIFGKVISGQEVVDAIGKVATYQGVETDTKKKDMPLTPIKIKKIYLEAAK